MTNDRDPLLQSLFDTARQELAEDAFTDQVISRIDGLRLRAVFGWAGVGLILIVFAGLITGPLTSVVVLASQVLPDSLFEVENRWLAQLLAPANSIAGLVAILVLGLRAAYKKIF